MSPLQKGTDWQDEQQLLALYRATHRHSDAIQPGPLLLDECRVQAAAVLCWAEDDNFDFLAPSPHLISKIQPTELLCPLSYCFELAYLKVSGTAATAWESQPQVTDVKPKTTRTGALGAC